MSIETQLREALAARADEVSPAGEDAYTRVSGAIRTSQRRRRTAYAGVMAAVVALAVVVPGLLRPGTDRTTTPATHTAPAVPGPSDPAWRSMTTWPTRGGLAGDAKLVRAVEELAAGRVIFIDDIASKRVALVVDPEQRQVAVVEGDAGAPAARLGVTSRGDTSAGMDDPSLTLTVDGSSTVVLTTPDVRTAQVSDRPDINVDGTVTRTWAEVTLHDGLVQVPAGSNLLRVRVAGSEGPVTFGVGRAPGTEDRTATICGDCRGEAFRRSMEGYARDSVSLLLGIPPTDLRTTTVYSGPVDPEVATSVGLSEATAPGADALLYVGNTTLPGGQVLQSAQLAVHTKDGTGQTMSLADGVPIDARTASHRPFLLAGDDGPAGKTGTGVRVQVFAAGAASVQLVPSSPTIWPGTAVRQLQAGTARIDLRGVSHADFTAHYEVVVRDARGAEVGRYPVELSGAGDPFAGTRP